MKKIITHLLKLFLVVAAILALITGAKYVPGYLANNQEINNNSLIELEDENVAEEIIDEKLNNQQVIDSIYYEANEDDSNAFDLLLENAEVEYKKYDFGVFAESVNGVAGDDKNFWAFYVNDEKANAGADVTTLNKADKVEWRYEKIIY